MKKEIEKLITYNNLLGGGYYDIFIKAYGVSYMSGIAIELECNVFAAVIINHFLYGNGQSVSARNTFLEATFKSAADTYKEHLTNKSLHEDIKNRATQYAELIQTANNSNFAELFEILLRNLKWSSGKFELVLEPPFMIGNLQADMECKSRFAKLQTILSLKLKSDIKLLCKNNTDYRLLTLEEIDSRLDLISWRAYANLGEMHMLYYFREAQRINSVLQKENANYASPNRDVKGCFIVTAVYGSEFKKIDVFYQFRNEVLYSSSAGRGVVKIYYFLSPPLAKFISNKTILKGIIRRIIIHPIYLVLRTILK